jgi:hypothetical protein
MTDLKAVYDRGLASLSAAYQSAISDYHLGQSTGDTDLAAEAAVRMAGLEATAREFHGLANRAASPQGAAPVDKYGLTESERAIAKNWTSDPNISTEDRLRTYSQQKARYQQARASGEYRDDQGRVTR